MAKSKLSAYIFTPGAANVGTVKIPQQVHLSDVLLITNTTRGEIIYSFSDPNKGATLSYAATDLTTFPGYTEGVTTLTLEYNTSTHNAADRILIYVDSKVDTVKISPSDILNDPVEKLRVSTPQALIDTDFEYSVQPSKWESLGMCQNYPNFFTRGSGGNSIPISSITGSAPSPFTVTVNATAHGLLVGDVVLVRELSGTNAPNAEGVFTILTVPNANSFTYNGRNTTASIASNAYSVVYGGGRFDNSAIPKAATWDSNGQISIATTAATGAGGIATISFTAQTQPPFYVGQSITVAGVTPVGYNATAVVTASTNSSVSYANATTAAQTVAGTITSSQSIITATTTAAHGLLPSSPIEVASFSGALSATRVAASAGRGYNASATITGVTFTSATNTPGTKGQCTVTTDANGSVSTIVLTNTGTGYTNPAQLTDCILDVATGSPSLTNSSLTVTNRASATTTRTLTTSVAHNLAANNWVTIAGINANYNGTFQVLATPTTTTFTYTTTTFTEASVASAGTVNNICRFTVDTEPANNRLTGNRYIVSVESPNTFKFIAGGTVGNTTTGTTTVNSTPVALYARADGYVAHRAQDGGCIISTSQNLIGVQQIRQTRRYFRYQSGKGIQMSTGIKFTPTFTIRNITSSGTTATITTIEDHGLQPGATILVEGIVVGTGNNNFNGTFTVASITGTKSFTYTMGGTPTDTAPGGDQMLVTVTNWAGSFVRVGLFDQQNGVFFEYDGSTIFSVRRQTIQELLGTIAVNSGSQTVTGTATRFLKQLTPGDYIVIKGASYLVNKVTSNTSLDISPVFRGSVNISDARYQKTIDMKVPQTQWNIDKFDGTGPSGYVLNLAKMQMAYLDYSWYGAGYIRYGFRSSGGQVSYCHKILNNNNNIAAYMRSGNLPARYEVHNFGYYSKLLAGATATRGSVLAAADATLHVVDATYWPSSGTVFVEDATNCELMTYTSKTFVPGINGWALGGLTRRTSRTLIEFPSNIGLYGTSTSVTFTPAPLEGGAGSSSVSVTLINQTLAPTVSHWGTSVIMDGRFDDDKNYAFTSGMRTPITNTAANATKPLISIRIAPSADNGIGRNFGVREIINRMQLTLKSIGIYSNGQFLIKGVLNATSITGPTFPTAWELLANQVGSGSLAQAIYHVASDSITGGEEVFSFYANNSGGASNFTTTAVDLTTVKELGTSILSGNGSATNPQYPNGPDILTITATNISATATNSIFARISWTEAQA